MPKKLTIIESAPISDDEEVSSSGSEIEQVEPPKRRGRGKNKQVTEESVIQEIVEDNEKEIKKVKKEKLIKPKKVKEPVEQPEPEVKLTKTGKVKKEVSAERREQLKLQLEKGRKTRAENFARKKAEKAELVEAMKIKIAEPVIKETIIKEKKAKKPKKIVEYVSDSSSSSSEEEVVVKKKSKPKREVSVKIPERIPTRVFQFV
jgi:hypothetical protein